MTPFVDSPRILILVGRTLLIVCNAKNSRAKCMAGVTKLRRSNLRHLQLRFLFRYLLMTSPKVLLCHRVGATSEQNKTPASPSAASTKCFFLDTNCLVNKESTHFYNVPLVIPQRSRHATCPGRSMRALHGVHLLGQFTENLWKNSCYCSPVITEMWSGNERCEPLVNPDRTQPAVNRGSIAELVMAMPPSSCSVVYNVPCSATRGRGLRVRLFRFFFTAS